MAVNVAGSLPASVAEHRAAALHVVGFAVITVSDTRTLATDKGGAAARRLIEAAGFVTAKACIVPDEAAQVREALEAALGDAKVDCVVLTGGTGVSRRDGTPDVVAPLLEVVIAGFGELFRMLSYQQVGSAAMLSRALGGLRGGKAVFCLPGSVAAVELGLERLILPEIGHLLRESRR